MSNEIIGVIGIIILVALLFSKMWVGMSMFLVGFIGCLILSDWNTAGTVVGMIPFTTTADYTMSCMPVFIFMGVLISQSGLGADLYIAARTWLGRLRGGLAIATVGACGIFAAVCGDSTTSAVTMSRVAYPEMLKNGYGEGIASSTIAAGGTIGILIPPSICMIIYGTITETSVGKLFMAGVIPGIIMVIFYMIVVSIVARRKNSPIPDPIREKVPMKEKLLSLKLIWPVLLVFIIMLAGMYAGFFTPTEAASIGTAVTLIVSIIIRRMTWRKFLAAIKEALTYTAMVYMLLIGAKVFMRFMALSRLPAWLSDTAKSLHNEHGVPALVILIVVLIFYIFFGMFMDVFATILLTLGFVYPIMSTIGYDLVWFGVIMTRMMEIGMISPPFGLNLFVCAKSCNVDMKTLYKGILPFVISDFFHVALLIAFPILSLWLPSLM